ncbi:4-nitrophenylphosphatase [Pseudohyphozyma bogoriensis]|nr:4-nitrophenylphosphatase [Pseudohyphozyma bogoriensis]
MPPPIHLASPSSFAAVLERYDTFLFDLDGVIWLNPTGNVLTPHIRETIALLRSLNKRIAFVTNNGTKSRRHYLARFHAHGIPSVRLEEIYTCASATASYVRDVVLPTLPVERREIYLIGEKGVEEEFMEVGLRWKGGTLMRSPGNHQDPEDDVLIESFDAFEPDPSIGLVVSSFQIRLNYKQLSKAYNYLATNPQCQLVLTNPDASLRLANGVVCMGEGAIAAPLLGAREGLVPITVGKPHQPLLDVVKMATGFDPRTTIMVGDRLDTDIPFGKLGGLDTMLVLTGSSRLADLDAMKDAEQPTYVAVSVGELLKAMAVM